MNDLLKKLNVLVKASIHDVLGDNPTASTRQQPITPGKLGKDIDREVKMLRDRINEALAYEDELQARVNTLQGEVASWDEKADAAVGTGDDANARYAIDQMQRAQQRTAIAEADLRDHQQVTQELILRVNTLEAAVADVRRSSETTAETEQPTEAPRGQVLSDVLKDVREKITQMGDMISVTPKDEANTVETEVEPISQDEETIDDDLEARRQRLSKPK
jgi:phage shock protein A